MLVTLANPIQRKEILLDQVWLGFSTQTGMLIPAWGLVFLFLENTMNAVELLPLVQQAQANGMRHLVLPNHFIPVDEALRWKTSYEAKMANACESFELWRSNTPLSEDEAAVELWEIHSVVRSAARDFCLYLRDLCILTQPEDWPSLPKELKASPGFQEYWNDSFESFSEQLYSDPD